MHALLRGASDEQLALQVQGGCQASFAELDRRCRDRVLHLVWRRLGHRHDAEDVAQQAMWRAYDRIGQFDARRRFRSWLFAIALNLATDHQRSAVSRRKGLHEPLRDLVDSRHDAATIVADGEQRAELWNLADRVLPAEQRTALWLHYREGMSPREIAEATGRSAVGVRVMLFRARKALLPHLERSHAAGEYAAGVRLQHEPSAAGAAETES